MQLTFALTALCGNTESMRNGKLMLACAETVEDETSLWKGKEKGEKIREEEIRATDFRG